MYKEGVRSVSTESFFVRGDSNNNYESAFLNVRQYHDDRKVTNHYHITIKGDVANFQSGDHNSLNKQKHGSTKRDKLNKNKELQRLKRITKEQSGQIADLKDDLHATHERVGVLEENTANDTMELQEKEKQIDRLEERIHTLEVQEKDSRKRENEIQSHSRTLWAKSHKKHTKGTKKDLNRASLDICQPKEHPNKQFVTVQVTHLSTWNSKTGKPGKYINIRRNLKIGELEKKLKEGPGEPDIFITNIYRPEEKVFVGWCFGEGKDKTIKDYNVKDSDILLYLYT
ncbi:hypothetical protein SNE40_018875 [Patella caerulea]|uniref:Uncharacterized protein n=1 Tax=Patella caerulea TaxID=87958 RepID=A0AAN8J8E3_PATCE